MKKLSAAAEKCFEKLNSISRICSIESAALAMYEDQSLPQQIRLAYYELYEYLREDYY